MARLSGTGLGLVAGAALAGAVPVAAVMLASPTPQSAAGGAILAGVAGLLALALHRALAFAREARRSREVLEDVLEAIPNGLVYWDEEDRLALFNTEFRRFYARVDDLIVPGHRFEDFVREAARRGQFLEASANPEAWVEALVARHRTGCGVWDREMPDGSRHIVSERRTRSGGIVAVRTDVTELGRTVTQLAAANANLAQANARIAELAHHDSLTGLPNRLALEARMAKGLPVTGRDGEPGHPAVLLLDLDRFKAVNDTHGHGAGDELLRAVAGRLRACVREGDFVARLGGDEFVILAADPSPNGTAHLASRIVQRLGQPYALTAGTVEVGVSAGIAFPARQAQSLDALLGEADAALYAAKDAGRGTFRAYAPWMTLAPKATTERLSLFEAA